MTTAQISEAGLIYINQASAAEFDSLSMVGLVRAEKIITSRPYISTGQLFDTKAISRSLYKIKDNLVAQ